LQVYTKDITVSEDDLDRLNHVNNVRYVQWVQDISEAHWLQNTPEHIQNNYYWVLVKHTIDYKGEALFNDTISVKTYVVSLEGVTSIRKVEMHNQSSGKLIVLSEAKWCLMDANTNRPVRVTPEIKALF